MSQATALPALAVWLTLTRALGQSALSVVSLAMVGQWFVRRIDTAMAIYSIAMSVGFMAAFPLVGFAVQSVGWRTTWLAVGVAVVAGSRRPPGCWCAGARNPCGLHPDGDERRRAHATARSPPRTTVAGLHVDRRPGDAGVLDLCGRRRALRAGRLGHRPLQRVDPRRARPRAVGLLPDPRRHGDDGARGQFPRRLARDTHAAHPAARDLARHPHARARRDPAHRYARGRSPSGRARWDSAAGW